MVFGNMKSPSHRYSSSKILSPLKYATHQLFSQKFCYHFCSKCNGPKITFRSAISQIRSINFKSILLWVTLRWGITNEKKHTLLRNFEAISAFHRLQLISNTVILWYIRLIHLLKTVCKAKVREAKSAFWLLPRLSI